MDLEGEFPSCIFYIYIYIYKHVNIHTKYNVWPESMYILSPNCVNKRAVILLWVFENVLFNFLVYSFWCQKNPFAGAVLCGALLEELYLKCIFKEK